MRWDWLIKSITAITAFLLLAAMVLWVWSCIRPWRLGSGLRFIDSGGGRIAIVHDNLPPNIHAHDQYVTFGASAPSNHRIFPPPWSHRIVFGTLYGSRTDVSIYIVPYWAIVLALSAVLAVFAPIMWRSSQRRMRGFAVTLK